MFKIGHKGLGYYQDGFRDDQGDEEEEAKDSLGNLAPVTLKLDGLIPDLQRTGKPLEATMQDDEAKEQQKLRRMMKGWWKRQSTAVTAVTETTACGQLKLLIPMLGMVQLNTLTAPLQIL